MAGYGRVRVRDQRVTRVGIRYLYLPAPYPLYDSMTAGVNDLCEDVVGNRQYIGNKSYYLPNPLTLVKTEVQWPVLNGGPSYQAGPTFVNYPLGVRFDPPAHEGPFRYPPDYLQATAWAWTILADSNLSQAHVSVPTFIGELKDIPGLVKDWGGSLLKKIAKGHLSWRWAIRPMINDVTKLLDFQRAVEQRVQMLRNLVAGKVIKRRVHLESWQDVVFQPNVGMHSSGGYVTMDKTTLHTNKVWGSIQYSLKSGTSIPWAINDAELLRFARRLTFGITGYELLATAWELFPFSWLTDWFVGIGDTIAALNNTIEVTPGTMCLMRRMESKAIYSSTRVDPEWIQVTGEHFQNRLTMTRALLPSPGAPLSPSLQPLVEWKTWSILGSLAILRRK